MFLLNLVKRFQCVQNRWEISGQKNCDEGKKNYASKEFDHIMK